MPAARTWGQSIYLVDVALTRNFVNYSVAWVAKQHLRIIMDPSDPRQSEPRHGTLANCLTAGGSCGTLPHRTLLARRIQEREHALFHHRSHLAKSSFSYRFANMPSATLISTWRSPTRIRKAKCSTNQLATTFIDFDASGNYQATSRINGLHEVETFINSGTSQFDWLSQTC